MEKARENFAALCRENGWKCTPQRWEVYRFLQNHRTHPGVDETLNAVRGHLPSVTRESVYRILNEFSAAGLLWRLDIFSGARYDTCTENHLHFICERCGSIADFPVAGEIPVPPELQNRKIRHTEVRITGVCSRCQTQNINPGDAGKHSKERTLS